MAALAWHAFGWGADGVTRITLSDTIPISETLSARVILGISDTIPVSEDVSTVAKAFIVVSDSIPVTESVSLSILNAISLQDNIPIVENVGKVVYEFGPGSGAVTLYYAMVDEVPEL